MNDGLFGSKKKRNFIFRSKKGFTIVEILAVIVILGVLLGVAAPAVLKYVGKSSQQSYDIMAKSAKEGVEGYLLDHPASSGSIRIKNLIEDQYLERTVDPEDQGEFCDGYVKYSLIEGDDESLDQYSYTVNLCCTEYQATYSFPEGTVTEITPSNFCDAIESVDPNTGEFSPPPTCNIKLSGTKKNGGYVSDVTVEMETEGIVLEKGLAVVSHTENGKTSLVHTEDGNNITYYGYVKNDIGEGTCEATFTKDTVAPTCPVITTNVENEIWTNEDVKFDFQFDGDTDNYNWFTNTSSSEYKDWGNNSKSTTSKTITGEGDRFVKLVVYDKYGNSSECVNENKHYYIDKTVPTCTVNLNGTTGENGWYVEKDVAVSLSTNDNGGSTVDSFDLTKSASPTYAGNTSGSQGNTASTTWYGYVKDKAGNLGSCNKNVKVDMTAPTCSLKKTGTWNSNGYYTTNVTVSFDTKTDTGGSNMASYGLVASTTPTYNSKNSITQGKTTGVTWYGYVKDTAGNTGSCNSGNFVVNLRTIPEFVYTGSYEIVDDSDNVISDPASYIASNWKIRFLSSGTLTFTNLYGAANGIDVFLVGGGGNGNYGFAKQAGRHGYAAGGGGGGGGYRTTQKGVSVSTTSYTISVGGAKTKSTAFGYTANPGASASTSSGSLSSCDGGPAGASGGASGGRGGVNKCDPYNGGDGGCEFDDCSFSSRRYGGGGGGGHGHNGANSASHSSKSYGVGTPGNGGAGGGGTGNNQYRGYNTHNGEANTGGGGGGGSFVFDVYDACGTKSDSSCNCWSSNGCFGVSTTTHYSGGTGGSGIVIIRNKR